MQNRVDYSVEIQFTQPCPQDAANDRPVNRTGTLLLGAGPPGAELSGSASSEVTACLYGGPRTGVSLVCRQAPHGRVHLSGRAWLSGDPATGQEEGTGASDPCGVPDGPSFCFELVPGETRPCTLRVRPTGSAPNWGAEIRLRTSNLVLDSDPGASIAAWAAALGPGLTGAALSGCEAVPGGHRVRYQHADVYFSPVSGAHELHGPVRDKYGALGGPGGDLGLPLTGVRATPDGQGRYAHFMGGGSVYWHPATGPMALRGALRDAWGAAGWEGGPLGYPTSDELTTGQHPWRRSVTFQNGVLLASDSGTHAPVLATLSAERVRAALDRAVRRATGGAGRPGAVALVGVSPTRADFRRSGGRVLTFRLTGGAGAGPPGLPAHGFVAELPLLFEAVPSPDSPGRTRLQARQFGAALFHADSPDPDRTTRRLAEQLGTLFGQPATLFEVPETAGFLALTVLPDGTLSLAFRPDVLGRLAAQAAQGQLDDLQF